MSDSENHEPEETIETIERRTSTSVLHARCLRLYVKRIRLSVSPELILERTEEITDLIEMLDNYTDEVEP